MKKQAREFLFSDHYRKDKDTGVDLSADCVHCGKKSLDGEPNKFKSIKKYKRGELVVIYREYDGYFFIITAFWNERGRKRK